MVQISHPYMIIGIDASKAASKKKTGIDNTAYQIILGLSKIDHTNSYYLYTDKPLDPILTKNPNFIEKLIPFPHFWNRFRLPLALLRDKPDMFIELTNNIPPLSPTNSIVLIHDLAFKFFPEAYSKFELTLQENAIKVAMSKASVIVFTSEANHHDFLKFYDKPKTKVAIIPLAYDSEIFNNKKANEITKVKDYPYFLSVGRIEKRKNTIKTVEAFEKFKKQNPTGHKLILVGKNGFGHAQVEEKISNSDFKNDIIVLGYIKDEELPSLYKNATAFIYPSLYEGFGLPALEAMAVGTPVLTSNVSTIKEVVGDAALLVDPQNSDLIAEGMKKLVFDKQMRKSLISEGSKIVKNYSWDKTAEEFHKLITKVD